MANRLLRKVEICRRLGFSRETLRRRLLDKTFPQPVYGAIGGPPLWPEDEVDAYIESLKSKRDNPGSEQSEAPSQKEQLSGRGAV